MPPVRHSTVAVPPVKRTVDRSGACVRAGLGSGAGSGDRDGFPTGSRDAVPDGRREGGVLVPPVPPAPDGVAESDAFASASRTAASSSGLLCAAPAPPSAPASCQAPSAPAAVPTATHAAVAAALRHFLMTPLCSIVS
ncbi:hypothetical protein D4104_17610 [Streptomyces alfalfae]|nr:hypothetical protein D4104_17610 [Streptomyces alfalfae]